MLAWDRCSESDCLEGCAEVGPQTTIEEVVRILEIKYVLNGQQRQ